MRASTPRPFRSETDESTSPCARRRRPNPRRRRVGRHPSYPPRNDRDRARRRPRRPIPRDDRPDRAKRRRKSFSIAPPHPSASEPSRDATRVPPRARARRPAFSRPAPRAVDVSLPFDVRGLIRAHTARVPKNTFPSIHPAIPDRSSAIARRSRRTFPSRMSSDAAPAGSRRDAPRARPRRPSDVAPTRRRARIDERARRRTVCAFDARARERERARGDAVTTSSRARAPKRRTRAGSFRARRWGDGVVLRDGFGPCAIANA